MRYPDIARVPARAPGQESTRDFYGRLSYRARMGLGCLACVGAMAFALFLQYGLKLEPCPMCIFQRVAMIAAGVFFGLGAALAPRGRGGRWAFALLALLAGVVGAAIAGRHAWLQHLPPDQVPACGPSLDYMLKNMGMPFVEVVATVLRGDGNCALVAGQWLGITLPEWTLAGFVALALWALYAGGGMGEAGVRHLAVRENGTGRNGGSRPGATWRAMPITPASSRSRGSGGSGTSRSPTS